ncbi:hypothetical protein V8E36_006024 [Tilletia maclaganii]
MTVTWIWGMNSVKASWINRLGQPWQQGSCVVTETARRAAWRIVAPARFKTDPQTITFHIVAAALLLIGVLRLKATETRLGTTLVRHGAVYILAACSAHAIFAGFVLANRSPVAALLPAMPSAVIVMMASTRLYVDLVCRQHRASSRHNNLPVHCGRAA